jgi:hypothetical protein
VCAVELTSGVKAPLAVQPERPLSKPPFTTPPPPPEGAMTVNETLVECVALAPVPVTVTV